MIKTAVIALLGITAAATAHANDADLEILYTTQTSAVLKVMAGSRGAPNGFTVQYRTVNFQGAVSFPYSLRPFKAAIVELPDFTCGAIFDAQALIVGDRPSNHVTGATQDCGGEQVNVTDPTIEIYSHQRSRLSAYIVAGSQAAVGGYTLHWKYLATECTQYVPGALRPGEATTITFPEPHNPIPCARLTCGTQYEIWVTMAAQESAHILDSTLFCE